MKKINTLLRQVLAHPAELFLGLALVFGMCMIFVMAPLIGSDEVVHFSRAYQAQQGDAWAQRLPDGQYGGYLPHNVKLMIDDYREMSRVGTLDELHARAAQLYPVWSSQKDIGYSTDALVFNNSAVYSPWAYTPSVVGIWLARLFHMPLLWYIYAARICGLLVWALLVWLAIRLLPSGKWLLLVVALLPTISSQAITVGPDGLVMGLAWVIIVTVLAVLARRFKLKLWQLSALAVAGVVLCTSKQGYWLIAALPLVLGRRYYASRHSTASSALSSKASNNAIASRGSILVRRIVFGLLLVVASLWFLTITGPIAKRALPGVRPYSYTNIDQQRDHVLQHPVEVFRLFVWQPITKAYDAVFYGLAGIMTNRLIYMSVLVVMLLYGAMSLAWSETKAVPALVARRRWLFLVGSAVIFGTFIAINLALYLSFTIVGNPGVEGLQGRYFVPLAPLLLLLPLTSPRRLFQLNRPVALPAILTIVVVGLIGTVLALN